MEITSAADRVFHCQDLLRQILEWNRPIIWITYKEHDNRITMCKEIRETGYSNYELDYYWTYNIYMWNENERQFNKLILSNEMNCFAFFTHQPEYYKNCKIFKNEISAIMTPQNYTCKEYTEVDNDNNDVYVYVNVIPCVLFIVQDKLINPECEQLFPHTIDDICSIAYVKTDYRHVKYNSSNYKSTITNKSTYTYYFANNVNKCKYYLSTTEALLKQHATTVLELTKHQAEHVTKQLLQHFGRICKIASSKLFL